MRAKTRKLGAVFYVFIVFFSFACSVNQIPGTWVLLGTRQIDEMTDMGVIPVGSIEGTFISLRLDLTDNLEINWVRVYFEDGGMWTPPRDSSIRQGLGARVVRVELPDEGKVIDRIEFRCIFAGDARGQTAMVRVFGRKIE